MQTARKFTEQGRFLGYKTTNLKEYQVPFKNNANLLNKSLQTFIQPNEIFVDDKNIEKYMTLNKDYFYETYNLKNKTMVLKTKIENFEGLVKQTCETIVVLPKKKGKVTKHLQTYTKASLSQTFYENCTDDVFT